MKFNIPEEVKKQIPAGCKIDLKTYLIIEYVAKVVSQEGSSFEFRLKIHLLNHKLPFLDSNHELHKLYKFLQNNPGYYLYNNDKQEIPCLLHELYEHIFVDDKDGIDKKVKSDENVIEGYSDSD
ncbi:hypothetical protein TpMuguga_01g00046 [Theileria parva strain Muguga]|uniref:SURP motif domain-containing protein n=1 Tax=Theileria parva TaxID=5875 RepID=Q4N9R8_THEPA|nr:uncharacterized protein TpMuguga_01g00046 [Theileria parva strain Muguga]EAN33290.1 hypothetical protein TpMuguga_01g00046 [Theileria parva strain Muguga]|eukprot:XP_765573.1 hypothetical protein [Theileria parva strain Muguga]